MGPVYLDHNASAPLKPAAKAAMTAALEIVGNPSSVHAHGRTARRTLEEGRRRVAALAGTDATRVLFTAGGTEANNLALRGFPDHRLLVSAIEHDSVLGAAPDADRVPVRPDGVLDLDALDHRLAAAGGPVLLSLMLVNNETGVVQPVAEAARRVHAHGGLVHTDAVQAAGRLPLNLDALGADLLSLSAHKIGGPAGVGALVVGDGLEPEPLLRGGGQERRRRAGTENLVGVAGFGAAAHEATREAGDEAVAVARTALLAALRDALEERALAAVPRARVLGADAPRVANTSCLALPGVPAQTQTMTLDLAGVSVGAGAACSSGTVKASHVLTAMGADAATAGSAIRISLGWTTTAADVDRFLAAWTAMARRLGTDGAA